MGVPPQIEVIFASVEKAADMLPNWESDRASGSCSWGISTPPWRSPGGAQLKRFKVGGVHHRTGAKSGLRFVYLTERRGGEAAQACCRAWTSPHRTFPTARAVPVSESRDSSYRAADRAARLGYARRAWPVSLPQ